MSFEQSDKQKIFISYSRRDTKFVSELIKNLEQVAQVQIFRDTQDILPTEKWKGRLEQLIEQADAIVFALSPHSAVSEVCRWEVEYAEGLNKRVAPIVIDEVEAVDVPADLAKYNYIFFTEGHDRHAALENLKTALTANIDWIREHTRYSELALRWHRENQNSALVLRGSTLSQAENWLAQQPEEAPVPTTLHHRFIRSSRKAASQRQRYWIIGSVAVALLSGGLAVLSEINRRDAVAERQRVERVLERTTQATKELVVEIANRYATRKYVPRELTTAVLQQARKLVTELKNVGETRGSLQMNGALALAELSDALRNNGERTAALSTAQESVAIFERLRTADLKSGPIGSGLFLALDRLGDILWDNGSYSEAEITWRRASQLADKLPKTRATTKLRACQHRSKFPPLTGVKVHQLSIAEGCP